VKRHFLFILISIFLASVMCAGASAGPRKETGIGNDFPVIMRGVRPLGMGNAFTAMPGTDTNAQFYNPAAINDFESKRHYEISAPMADFTPRFFNLVTGLLDLRHQLHSAKSAREKIRYFEDFTTRNTGDYEQFTTGMSLFHVRHKHYAAGFIVDGRAVISLRNQAFPNFEFKSHVTGGIVGGTAWGFFDDTLQIGGNIKVLYRAGIEDQITTGDILIYSIKQLIGWRSWKKGFGAGADFGAKYKLPLWREKLRPTIALTVQDIADTRFTGDVEKLPMSVTVGAGIFPVIGGNELAILMDFRELNHQTHFLRKFHAGIEANLPKLGQTQFAIRGGCNQGYPAVGVSANWSIMKLDLAFYGEEAGQYTQSKGNYRLDVSFSFPL
jgi:hypothetical protein